MKFDGQFFYRAVSYIDSDLSCLILNGRSISLSKIKVGLLRSL